MDSVNVYLENGTREAQDSVLRQLAAFHEAWKFIIPPNERMFFKATCKCGKCGKCGQTVYGRPFELIAN